MEFSELMQDVSNMFNNWMNDETILNHYGDKEALQKEFLSCIQKQIGSDFILLTKDELLKEKEKFHSSMEGTNW
jgi:hypothetical protein